MLAELDVDFVVALPLAQHSSHVYAQAVVEAAKGRNVRTKTVENWGQTPALLDAFAARIRRAFSTLPSREDVGLVLSSHSLPKFVVDAGDPYEREVRAASEAVAARVRDVTPDVWVAFQSQGMSTDNGRPGGKPVEWLGPDLPATLDLVAAKKKKHVVVAPIGFLADHVEILYDLDVELKRLARERGLTMTRTESLNDADDFVEVLAGLARRALSEAPS